MIRLRPLSPSGVCRSAATLLALAVAHTTTTPCFAAKPKAKAATPAAQPAPTPAPTPAPAGPKPLADSLSDDAKAAYEAGKLLYGDGDYAGARVKFQAAYDLSKDPRLLWNAAACEKGQRHYAKVVVLVKTYLETGGDLITTDDRKDAQDLLQAIESFTVGLTLSVNEPDAQIVIDGENVGTSPLAGPVTVDIGSRQISVQKPGFLPFSQTLPVGGSKDAALTVTLVPEVHAGTLTVNGPQGAAISIDGKPVGTGTFTGSLPSGGHTLRVEAPGMRPYQSEVVVQDNEKRGIDVVLEPVARAVSAPQAEPTGPLHDMELGLRFGYGSARTKAKTDTDTAFQKKQVNFVPVQLDIGYRLGRPTYLGVFGQYGWLNRSDTCGYVRHDANPDFPGDSATRYGYDTCRMLRTGVMLAFHVLPRTIIDPWFGFDAALHVTFARYRSYDPRSGESHTGNDDQASFQPTVQLGVDAHPIPALGAGIYAQGGPDIGSEGKPKDDNNGGCVNLGGKQVCPNTCNNGSSCNNDSGVGSHVVFGVRVAYTFP